MQELYVGIDVGGTNTKIVLLDGQMNPVAKDTRPTCMSSLEAFTDDLCRAVEDCMSTLPGDRGEIQAFGMGVPGLVDSFSSRSIYLPLHLWNGVNPCEGVAQHFDAPSVLDNDANINALGERFFGRGRQYRDFLYITVGTGIGGAAVCGGKLLRGRCNAAMEIGHMTVVSQGGRPCVCGKTGCLEPYCSGTAMRKLAEEEIRTHPESLLAELVRAKGTYDNELTARAAQDGDPSALRVIEEISYYLGLGIANLCKIFNPEAVFVGGGVSNAGDVLLDPVRAVLATKVMHPSQDCPVFQASLRGESGMFGAAAMAAESVGRDLDQMLIKRAEE